jgi:hypothetical protein
MDQRYYTAIDKSPLVTSFVLIVLIVLTGCETTPIPIVAPPTAPTPTIITAKVEPPTVEPRKVPLQIPALLEAGDIALMNEQLTTPLEDNAYFRYLQVLSIDPQNEAAEQGIANIVDRYLDWSIQSVEMGRYHLATDYLNKARSVDENHPNIATVESMIEFHLNGNQKSFAFSRNSIQDKEPAVISELKTIAGDISSYKASIVIEAPSDEMGRWIYQQLNESAQERVQARFEMTSRVRIHLFY